MALLAFDAPSPTSGSRSTTTTSSIPRAARAQAIAQPMTPPPITTTSARSVTGRSGIRRPRWRAFGRAREGIRSGRCPRRLAADQEVALHPVGLQVDDRRLHDPFGVLRARVEAERSA